ncbi:MAG: proton-translocating NADH-quinone oxidoreductase subunit N [Verrucomicrobiales bacterium]|nr:proton-translocating NADH-quinone oxidoreductase subunit N [Verrucomicrobiales bacterium]|tara:strand:- start:3354 stop:4970 length:1617 start_codon:yes stop_codon:yes gene_type:complete
MNLTLVHQEICITLTGVLILLLDLCTPPAHKTKLGWLGIAALALVLLSGLGPLPAIEPGDQVFHRGDAEVLTVTHTQVINGHDHLHCTRPGGQPLDRTIPAHETLRSGFHGGITQDALAQYFKTLSLTAAILVLLLGIGFASRLRDGVGEFFALTCFALVGMMFAAGAANFVVLFAAIELITITFYVLTSFQRHRLRSLEAGVKYLILGAAASALMVYGIALIYGATGTMSFYALQTPAGGNAQIFNLGLLLLLAGLGFKIAAVPFQVWAPDVYQGAPAPVTAFLAIGSKAAGVVLLLRLAATGLQIHTSLLWPLFNWIAAATIAYGSLCALRQRNLKRLIGYAGIASAGYLLLGIVALRTGHGHEGSQAILYYLAGYLFAIIAAFMVISRVTREADDEDLSVLAGLHQRSPLMATVLTLAIVSLAGIPPLAGFLGKFLLIKPILAGTAQGAEHTALIIVALAGVVVSLYYYFAVIREIYWSAGINPHDRPQKLPVFEIDWATRLALIICAIMLVALGLFPEPLLAWAREAVTVLALH